MTYPSCLELVNLDATCNAVKKFGGVASRVWVGSKKEWLNDTINVQWLGFSPLFTDLWALNFANINNITGLELAYFEGVSLKNSAGFELVAAENVNAFTHNVNLVLFSYTAEQISKLEQLILQGDMFVILQTNNGDFKVYGCDINTTLDGISSRNGLTTSSGNGGDIVELQGEVGYTITLTALNMVSMPFVLDGYFDAAGEDFFTDTITVLNLLSENNA